MYILPMNKSATDVLAVLIHVQALIYEQVRDNSAHIRRIPRFTVTRVGGKWFTFTGNRRLWVYRKLEEEGYLDEIELEISQQHVPRNRLTTKKGGASVVVRGGLHRSSTSRQSRQHLWARSRNDSAEQSLVDTRGSSFATCIVLGADASGYAFVGTDGSWN